MIRFGSVDDTIWADTKISIMAQNYKIVDIKHPIRLI